MHLCTRQCVHGSDTLHPETVQRVTSTLYDLQDKRTFAYVLHGEPSIPDSVVQSEHKTLNNDLEQAAVVATLNRRRQKRRR